MGEIGGKKPKVVIVGAGMAGLAAGRRLHDFAGELLDIIVVDSGDRIGGRILTSEFAGAQIEIGATWIHGIDGSPIYEIAEKSKALIPNDPATFWERMDVFPPDPLTLAEGGLRVDPSLLSRISAVFSNLKHRIASAEIVANGEIASVGEFLRRGFETYRGANRRDWIEEAAFAMHECGERTYTAVDDLESLDLGAEREYCEFPGEHITLPGGYSRVPEFLAAALPAGSIRLRRKVSGVEWNRDGDPVRIVYEDGGVEVADHAIVTVSLGVLKAGVIGGDGLRFSPALPEAKVEAIRRLGFGLVTKLFMELEEGEGGEMKKSPSFPFLRMAFDPSGHVAEIPRWMRRTDSICPIHGGSRVLLAWFVGREAAEVEKMEDDEIIRGVQATLEGFSPPPAIVGGGGGFGRIGRVRKSGWGKDPGFMGSYSYVAVGSSGDDQDALADPLPGDSSLSPMQILFAGEATHRTRYATTHGAYLSGVREADRLLRHYGIHRFGS